MRLKSLLISVVSLHMLVLVHSATATSSNDSCDLLPGLHSEISQKYPHMHIVALTDLNAGDKELFQKDHNGRCPGLVKVDFYGDGMPTWALALTAEDGSKTELVVARQLGKRWKTTLLETTDGPAPVVWRQVPGKYRDVYGEKTIRATHPVIVFCGYNSWAVIYAWSGKEVNKIWLSD
jgi:hypothetical protein